MMDTRRTYNLMMLRFNLVSNQVAWFSTGDEQPRAEIRLTFHTGSTSRTDELPETPPSLSAFSSLPPLSRSSPSLPSSSASSPTSLDSATSFSFDFSACSSIEKTMSSDFFFVRSFSQLSSKNSDSSSFEKQIDDHRSSFIFAMDHSGVCRKSFFVILMLRSLNLMVELHLSGVTLVKFSRATICSGSIVDSYQMFESGRENGDGLVEKSVLFV